MNTNPAIETELTRIFIVDDHPTVREGLRYRIGTHPEMSVCGEASDMHAALEQIAQSHPDVVIVDLALKNSDGLELIKAIQGRFPDVRVLVHSMYEEAIYAERCLRAGAMGYVNKEADPQDVMTALHEILAGRIYLSSEMANLMLTRTAGGADPQQDPIDTLTDRQLEVFRFIGQGKTAAEIAKLLHISVHTVETHRDNIKQKLNAASLSELNRIAVLWDSTHRR